MAVYLAVPYVYFSAHPSKKRFHFLNGRFEFRKRRGNFLSPIPISTHNIATKKWHPFSGRSRCSMKWVCRKVFPWCMLTALSTMPCRQLGIIIPVSSNFLNFQALDLAAFKIESQQVSLALLFFKIKKKNSLLQIKTKITRFTFGSLESIIVICFPMSSSNAITTFPYKELVLMHENS